MTREEMAKESLYNAAVWLKPWNIKRAQNFLLGNLDRIPDRVLQYRWYPDQVPPNRLTAALIDSLDQDVATSIAEGVLYSLVYNKNVTPKEMARMALILAGLGDIMSSIQL